MGSLYKFTELRFADSILRGEAIAIGTLWGYSNVEKYALQKGDKDEGIIRTQGPPVFDSSEYKDFSSDVRQVTGIDFGRFISVNCGTHLAVLSEDHYVFCMSEEMNDSIAMALDPKYDCCIRIGRPARLSRSLTAALRRAGAPVGDILKGPVTYKSRTVGPGVRFNDNLYQVSLVRTDGPSRAGRWS